MNPTDRVLSALREKGYEPKRAGAGWCCRCPAHEDTNPSLSINTGDDGRVLVKCHAGCSGVDVCGAIGLSIAYLFVRDPGRRDGRASKARRLGDGDETDRKPARDVGSGTVAGDDTGGRTFPTARDALAELERRYGPTSTCWSYTNADGEAVGIVARWNTPTAKTVRPVSRKADSSGWCIAGMPTPRPLYALPDLLATKLGDRVFITEGEKAADAARSCGLVATTSPHGSQSAAMADWSAVCGRDVVILPDHDAPGEKYAADVARLARSAGAKSVRIVRLANLWADMPEGGDVVDLLNHRGGDADAVRAEIGALAGKAEATKPSPELVHGDPVIVCLSDVKPEPIEWLWRGRFALGKLSLIVGDPGLGKSLITLDMAARVSRGAPWPDAPNDSTPPGGVVLLNAEDDPADTIRPRLDAAGADLKRIVVLESIHARGENGRTSTRTFNLADDIPALEKAIQSTEGCRLVVIDPVSAYLGGTDSHNNADIRGLLAPLSALAAKYRVAVVCVTHLNKSGGGPAIYRTMGSLAFAAAARAAWSVSKDKDDPRRRLFLPVKNNLAADTGGLAYRVEPFGDCPVLVWESDPVTMSADDALTSDRSDGGGRTERDDAADWLRELLKAGPCRADDVKQEAKGAGHSLATLRRAKAAIGVLSVRAAFGGGWDWVLPESNEDARHPKVLTQDAHSPSSERLGTEHAEINGIHPKALTSPSVSALGEHLGDTPPTTDGGRG